MKHTNKKLVFYFICALIATFVVALSLNCLLRFSIREAQHFIGMTSLTTCCDWLRRLLILVLIFLGGIIVVGKIEVMLSGAVAICLAPAYKKWFALISVPIVYFVCWFICCIEHYCRQEGACVGSVSDFVKVVQDMTLGMPLYCNGVMVRRGPSEIWWLLFYDVPFGSGILPLLYIVGLFMGYIVLCKRGGNVGELFRKDWVIGRIIAFCSSPTKKSSMAEPIPAE